jgi:hypothetical protein
MVEPRTLQAGRKADLEQAVEEIDLLCQLAERGAKTPRRRISCRSPDLIFQPPISAAYCSAAANFARLEEQFQTLRKPSKVAAHSGDGPGPSFFPGFLARFALQFNASHARKPLMYSNQ